MTTERRFVFPRRLKKVRAISIKSHSKQDLTVTMKNLFGKWENEMPHHTFLEAIFDL